MPSMWHHFANLFWRAFHAMVSSQGQTTLGWLTPYILGTLAFGVAVLLQLRSKEKLVTHIRGKITLALGAAVIANVIFYGFLWSWNFVRLIYEDHIECAEANAQLRGHVKELSDEIEVKRQNLQTTDPAFHNMTDTIRLFMGYRRAIGPSATCRILVTLPKGEEHNKIYMPFITFVVFGSNCPNGDLQNIGIKPENVDDENVKGMIPGAIVLHAPPGTKGADGLADGLGNLIQTKRSFTLPTKAPENTIWIQFGTDVKWNTELFSKSKKP